VEEVEVAAEIAYNIATKGASTSFAKAHESIKEIYRQIARAVLELRTHSKPTEDDLRAAKAEVMEEFATYILVAHESLEDRYTMRKLSLEASRIASELRNGNLS